MVGQQYFIIRGASQRFPEIVSGSAKTGHNHASLNLQYNALKILGPYLRIDEKIL